jgi:hypothetical protein
MSAHSRRVRSRKLIVLKYAKKHISVADGLGHQEIRCKQIESEFRNVKQPCKARSRYL